MGSCIQRPDTAFALDPSTKKRMKDEGHLAFIRTLPCLITGRYRVEACHIRYGDPLYNKSKTAKGQKPHDAWVVPLCPESHREQHSGSEALFWRKQGIDPLSVARDLYQISGDEQAAKRIITAARVRKAA